MKIKNLLTTMALTAVFLIAGKVGWGQINISVGSTVSENFDGIGTTATATTPTNWKVDKNTTVRTLGTYAAAVTATERVGGNNMSTTASAGIYNFGAGDAATATDRAIGGLSSSSASKSVNIYTWLTNNGTTQIDYFTVSFDVEKYRGGSNAAGFTIQMYYSTDGSTWTSAGDNFKVSFTADADNSGYASAPGATTSITSKNLNVSIPVSGNLYLAWNYSVSSGTTTSNAQALSIDNVSISGYADTTPPVATFDPANATTDVAIDKDITITFDEAIRNTDDSAIDDTNVGSLISLRKDNSSGAVVTFTATIDADIITINPTSDFDNSQVYYVAIAPVEDAANNATGTLSATFTTISASTPTISNATITEAGPYYAGQNITVNWTSANVDFVKIDAWKQSISDWAPIVASTDATDGTEVIAIPSDFRYSTTFKVRVSYVTDPTVNAESATATVIAVTSSLVDLHSYSANDIVKYTGKATVTYTRTTRNQKYIQDASGAVLIDDNTTAPGYITDTYSIGDGITNVQGKIYFYNGLTELVPTATTGEKITDGSNPTITPELKTISSLTSTDQSKLVKISNYAFATTGQYAISNLFVSSKNYDIVGYSNTAFVYRTAFSESDYIGQTIPTSPITTVGLVGKYNAVMQITARNLADFQSAATSITSFEVPGQVGTSVIDETNHTITFVMPSGASLTGLTPTIAVSAGATVSPASLAPQTFVAGTPVNYTVTAEDGITTQVYAVTAKVEATVTISNTTVTYNGSEQEVTVTTDPTGLTVNVTYNGSTTKPTNAGEYAVVATINDAAYTGSSSATFTIAKASATVTISNTNQTYDGEQKSVTTVTNPVGMDVNVTYNGSATAPTNAGTYDVVATINNSNYEGSANGTLTIAKATATVTISNTNQTYDGTQKSVTTVTNPGDLNVNVTYDGSATAPTNAGTYDVVATINNSNYEGSANGTLTIAKAPATVTISNTNQTYDGTQKSVTTVTDPVGLDVNVTYDGSATAPTNAGTYDVVATINNSNYEGSANGTLTIAKATATVTLGTLTFIYDGDPKPVTATTTPDGLTVDITYEGINGTVYALSTTAPSAIGQYAVVATVNESNYEGSANGTLTITDKTPATVTITNITATYDGNAHPVTVTTTKTSDGTPISVTVNVTYNGSTTAPTNAGSYPVVATIDDETYVGVGNATLTINKATLTVTADNKTKTYGDANPTFTGSISGFVNSEDASVITGTPSYTCTATATTPAGTVNIVPNVGTMSATNYSFATVNGTLTIDKAQLTVTADNKTRVYGAENPTFTSVISGMVNSETVATACSGTPAYTCTAIGTSPVGTPVAITPTLGTLTSANYNFTFVDGELTITKAELTVTADPKTKVYGEANPTFTGTITGFANSETESVINGNAVYTCAATETTNVGTVDIITDVTGMTANNYTFTGVNSTLTITKATATITISNTEQAYDGTAKPVTVVTDPEGLTVEVTYDGSTTVPVSAGTYAVVATINETNYEGTQSATLTITRPEGDLFFSEYIEGSSNNKALEIYNPTNADIALSGYILKGSSNEATDWENEYPFPAGAVVQAKGVYVIAPSTASSSILAVANWISTGYECGFNGNDSRGLFKIDGDNTVLIDMIGTPVNPTAANYDVAGVTGATLDHTLVRKDAITSGNTNWAASAGTNADNSEWIVKNKDDFSFLGWHISKSNAKDILAFSLAEQEDNAVIDATAHTVNITVINGTIVTALTPTIKVSNFAKISPASGVATDFTNPVTYTVTAQDGTTQAWTVTVTVSITPSSKKDITSFAIANQIGSSVIDATAGTVTVLMPYGTTLTSLTPTITVSAGATINPASGTPQDFSSAVTYTVTAQNTETKAWTVTVTNQVPVSLSIHDIQYTTATPAESPYKGQLVRTKGIVTAVKAGTSTTSFYLQDGDSEWGGIYVYSSSYSATVGDSVEIVATVAESYSVTQLNNAAALTILNQGNTLPTPVTVSTLAANNEKYESMLVKVTNATCNSLTTTTSGGSTVTTGGVINDGTGDLTAYYGLYSELALTVGTIYDITGVISYFGSIFEILPRNANDVTVHVPTYTVTFNVTHNSTAMEGVTITVNSQTLTTNASGVATIDLANGDYNFTATKSGYNDYSGSFTVASAAKNVDVVMYATDVETNTIASLKAFPNPFSNEIKFSGADITRVTITSIIGQVVMDKTVSGENSINTQELVRGIYLVKFTNNKGESTLRKLVKE